MEKKAILAAGCFWHVEEGFSKLPGVIKTRVGYTGGILKNPTYEQVCSGKTGHAEAVEITFDLDKINYKDLLGIFWKIHNPTTPNQQGADVGSNYRSAIFYSGEEQKKAALESKSEIQENFDKNIVTEITKASKFYPAEEYHQKYFEKNKNAYCRV